METDKRGSRVLLGGACCALLFAACGGSGEAPRPNVLVISIDTLRADHVGSYGYERATTPFLDSLAREGTLFENAFSVSSWTLPSHVSLLTARHPATHRVEHSNQVLPEGVESLAGVLGRAGYDTAAFTTWLYVSERYGLDRGFDTFEYLEPLQAGLPGDVPPAVAADELAARVERWLDEDPAAAGATPDFLFLHLIDPHLEYAPPLVHAQTFDPELEDTQAGSYVKLRPHVRSLAEEPTRCDPEDLARAVALYDGEIRYVDEQLARLFGRLGAAGWLDDALVFVTSDHGEEFDEHAALESHGMTLYDEMLRIPLLMRLPAGADADHGRRRADLVQLTDIAPTVLDYLRLPAPAGFEGRSLLTPPEEERFVLASTKYEHAAAPQWALRTRTHKLIYHKRTKSSKARFELFDLERDPGEQRDVWDPQDPDARRLRTILKAWMDREREGATNDAAAALSDEDRARLQAMGYGGPLGR